MEVDWPHLNEHQDLLYWLINIIYGIENILFEKLYLLLEGRPYGLSNPKIPSLQKKQTKVLSQGIKKKFFKEVKYQPSGLW